MFIKNVHKQNKEHLKECGRTWRLWYMRTNDAYRKNMQSINNLVSVTHLCPLLYKTKPSVSDTTHLCTVHTKHPSQVLRHRWFSLFGQTIFMQCIAKEKKYLYQTTEAFWGHCASVHIFLDVVSNHIRPPLLSPVQWEASHPFLQGHLWPDALP